MLKMKTTILWAVAFVGLGLCGTDVCTAQTARPVQVRSCWAAMDPKTEEIYQSYFALKGVDTTTLSVDIKEMYRGGHGSTYKVITWSHTVPGDKCGDAKPAWFPYP
ncbi:hypothetical protein DZC73_03490 [Albitalea terrae]|uniref:Uncharacterized protein n=1 Tax=Piscinibacter terrae TaxID=2496871 RepID=A0A3N7HUU2_9BURK|nr:hypothetical protein DZC73_03490 [Albitalea terrae]